MKVVVTGQMQYYGSVSRWASNSWEELGHEVVRIEYDQLQNLPKKADIYFFCDVSTDFSNQIPSDLEGLKVFWAMDVQMPGGTERSVNIARKCDYTFCGNYEYGVKILEKFGIESTWVTYGYDMELKDNIKQMACDPFQIKFREGELSQKYQYDVCMIGNPNSQERQQLWNLLKEKYGDRAVTGQIQSKEEYITKKAYSQIMVAQPTEPFNTIINLRVFNALACGKLLLCKRPTIKEHEMLGMKDGVNLVYWDTFDDLIEKIDYYLEHIEESDKIARAGAILGEKYLMPNQIRIIEQTLFSKFYQRFS